MRAAVGDLRPIAHVIIEEARRLERDGLIRLFVLVVMPDHCHVLFQLAADTTLARAMKLLKGRSSRNGNRLLQRTGRVWQDGFYDRHIRTVEEARSQWWYILRNPVRRRLAPNWRDYQHTYRTRHADALRLWQGPNSDAPGP